MKRIAVFCLAILAVSCAGTPDKLKFKGMSHGISALDAIAADGGLLYALSSDNYDKILVFKEADLNAGNETALGYLKLRRDSAKAFFAHDLIARDGILYLATGNPGLTVVNARSPETLVELDPVNPELGPCKAIAIEGKTLYAGFDGAIAKYDLSEPLAPKLIAQAVIEGKAFGIAADGARVLVARGENDVLAFKTEDLSAEGTIQAKGFPTSIVMAHGHAYILDDFRGLQVASLEGNPPWKAVEAYQNGNLEGSLVLKGNRLAACSRDGRGILLFSLESPGKPALQGHVMTDYVTSVSDIAFTETEAFAAWDYPSILRFNPESVSGAPPAYATFTAPGANSADDRAVLYGNQFIGVREIDGKPVSMGLGINDFKQLFRVYITPGKHALTVVTLDSGGDVKKTYRMTADFTANGEYLLQASIGGASAIQIR